MSEDAADEVVKIALNGTEVMIRLAGSGARNLASLLVEWSRNEKRTGGKTSIGKLLASGDTLQVLTLDQDTYRKFRSAARNRILYAAFADRRKDRQEVDVIFGQRNAALMDYLLDRIGYAAPVREEDAPLPDKKKETPSSERSAPPEDRAGGPGRSDPNPPSEKKESVIGLMQRNLQILRESGKAHEKAPGKSRGKSR